MNISFAAIKEIIASCGSTDRFAVAVVILFTLTHRGEMNAEGDGTLHSFKAD